MSQQCALAANKGNGIPMVRFCQPIEGCDPSPLLSTGEATLEVLGSALDSSVLERDMDTLERVQQRAIKVMKGLEHVSCERAGTVKLGQEKAQGWSHQCL